MTQLPKMQKINQNTKDCPYYLAPLTGVWHKNGKLPVISSLKMPLKISVKSNLESLVILKNYIVTASHITYYHKIMYCTVVPRLTITLLGDESTS